MRSNIFGGLFDNKVALDDSIVFGIIVREIIVHVNVVWGLFDGNISAPELLCAAILFGDYLMGIFLA